MPGENAHMAQAEEHVEGSVAREMYKGTCTEGNERDMFQTKGKCNRGSKRQIPPKACIHLSRMCGDRVKTVLVGGIVFICSVDEEEEKFASLDQEVLLEHPWWNMEDQLELLQLHDTTARTLPRYVEGVTTGMELVRVDDLGSPRICDMSKLRQFVDPFGDKRNVMRAFVCPHGKVMCGRCLRYLRCQQHGVPHILCHECRKAVCLHGRDTRLCHLCKRQCPFTGKRYDRCTHCTEVETSLDPDTRRLAVMPVHAKYRVPGRCYRVMNKLWTSYNKVEWRGPSMYQFG